MTNARTPLAEVELAMEQLFRLGANRRFDARQTAAVDTPLTRAGYAVLRCLTATDVVTVSMLADSCVMDAATASRQVDRLVGDGLVARRPSPADARAVEITITDTGRRLYEDVVAYRLGFLRDALADWPDSDLTAAAESITRLTNDLRLRSDDG